MVWSDPNEADNNDEHQQPITPSRSRRRSRPLSTTSTDYTSTNAGSTDASSSKHTQRRLSSRSASRSPTFQQAPVLLPYAPSVTTQATATTSSGFPSSRTHVSPTPGASQEQPTTYDSQPQSSSYSIPSAQPVRPLFDPTDPSQQFSMSDVPSPYPSPPDSPTNDFDSSLRPLRSHSPPPEESIPSRQQYQQSNRYSLPQRPKEEDTPRPRGKEKEKEQTRQQTRSPKTTSSKRQDFEEDADDIDNLLNTVLDGIGRLHVAMDQDDAGRWRIKRTGSPSD